MKYHISKPTPSVAIYALGLVVVLGLIALFIAAFFAFSEVMPWYQALFAAFLIEAGAVVEALALARDNNWIAAGGLSLSLVVSVTYNYIQAQQAGAGKIENWWQLLTLAVGPLTALTFLSLTLGKELRDYREVVHQWELDHQEWVEKENLRIERKLARERREREKVANLQRIMASSKNGKIYPNVTDWRHVPSSMYEEIAEMSPSEVMDIFPAIAPRTARDYPKKAQLALISMPDVLTTPSKPPSPTDGEDE